MRISNCSRTIAGFGRLVVMFSLKRARNASPAAVKFIAILLLYILPNFLAVSLEASPRFDGGVGRGVSGISIIDSGPHSVDLGPKVTEAISSAPETLGEYPKSDRNRSTEPFPRKRHFIERHWPGILEFIFGGICAWIFIHYFFPERRTET